MMIDETCCARRRLRLVVPGGCDWRSSSARSASVTTGRLGTGDTNTGAVANIHHPSQRGLQRRHWLRLTRVAEIHGHTGLKCQSKARAVQVHRESLFADVELEPAEITRNLSKCIWHPKLTSYLADGYRVCVLASRSPVRLAEACHPHLPKMCLGLGRQAKVHHAVAFPANRRLWSRGDGDRPLCDPHWSRLRDEHPASR